MEHTKKYLVVPYVKNIEKPSESYLHKLDQNMDEILYDNKLAPDIKLKLYSKNLNNFLLKYNPDSFGLAPTLTNLARVITNYLNNDNNPKVIEKDLKPLFDTPNDYKPFFNNNLFEKKNPNDKNRSFNQNAFDYHNYQSDNDSSNSINSTDKLDTNITYDQNDEEDNETFQTVSNEKSLNNSNQSEIITSSSDYPTSTRVNTRSLKLPLKSPLKSSKRAKKDNKNNSPDSFLNKDTSKKNKYKHNNSNPNKSGIAKSSPLQKGKDQVANGLWKTKRFF
jgi:hypothetical protein